MWFITLDLCAFMVWKHARRALSRPYHDLCKNHIYHLKGLAFRNSFWYAAKNSNSSSNYTLIGTLYSTHKKTHHKQKLFFPELCEVEVSGSCANYVFMKFRVWLKSAKAQFSSFRPDSLRNALYMMICIIVLKSSSLQNSCNGKE